MRALLNALLLGAALAVPAQAAEIVSSVDEMSLPDRKRTSLDLYVSSRDAAAALANNPDIVLFDVRTRAEFQFVGHPAPTDANIPFRVLDTGTFGGKSYAMQANPDFVRHVETWMQAADLGKTAPIFVICRSGGRSAGAANALADAGFTNVWNVIDGFEGGKDKTTGHRTVEGWRAEALPWTYAITPDQAYLK